MKKEQESSDKKTSPDAKNLYVLPEKYKGIAYPRIKMDNYIIISYLFADEKRYYAHKYFGDLNVVYIDGYKIGLESNDNDFKKNYNKDEIGLHSKEHENKKKYHTKFGEFLFKSWNWLDRTDLDRFIILVYKDKLDRHKYSERYFGDSKINVCDGLDYGFIRIK